MKEVRINSTTVIRIGNDGLVRLVVYRRCSKSAVWGENESILHLDDMKKLFDTLWIEAERIEGARNG
jgi:hypothetical protein